MKNKIVDSIKQSIEIQEGLLKGAVTDIEKAAKMIIASLKGGGKLLIFGNGGSAADSQHIAAEFVGRFKKERRPFAAIALTTDSSVMTALANDYGYEATFARQVEALGRPGDVALAISTSGNSGNVIEALKKAKSMGIKTIGLAGGDGGRMKRECDCAIVVACKDTPRIQESHITIGHVICELVEDEMIK